MQYLKVTTEPQLTHNLTILNRWTISYETVFLIAAIITAYLASRSFKASRRQNELSTMPLLYFDGVGDLATEQKLVIINKNGRFAFDIKLDSLEVLQKSTHTKDWLIDRLTFQPHYTNEPKNFLNKEDEHLFLEIYNNNEQIQSEEIGFFTWSLKYSYKLKGGIYLTYRDAQNLKFFTEIAFDNGVVHIKRAPTRFTATQQTYKKIKDLKQFIRKMWWKLRIKIAKLIY